jgi:hypothetical protein
MFDRELALPLISVLGMVYPMTTSSSPPHTNIEKSESKMEAPL